MWRDIPHWASQLPCLQPSVPDSRIPARAKRKTSDQQRAPYPISPPNSTSIMSDEHHKAPCKRRRTDASEPEKGGRDRESEEDMDETPRAGRRHRLASPHRITSSSRSSSRMRRSRATDDMSQRSGASSPLKQMTAMELSEEPVRQRTLSKDDPTLPASVLDMLLKIERGCKYGRGILPQTSRVSIFLLLDVNSPRAYLHVLTAGLHQCREWA